MSQTDSLEEIQARLILLRQNAITRCRFPQELWDSIIHLSKTHPIKEICQRLQIHPVYLKRKIRQSHQTDTIDFREIPPCVQETGTSLVVIELSLKSGLKARIQGPLACLNCLDALFKD